MNKYDSIFILSMIAFLIISIVGTVSIIQTNYIDVQHRIDWCKEKGYDDYHSGLGCIKINERTDSFDT